VRCKAESGSARRKDECAVPLVGDGDDDRGDRVVIGVNELPTVAEPGAPLCAASPLQPPRAGASGIGTV
jgi:hypothetical protein